MLVAVFFNKSFYDFFLKIKIIYPFWGCELRILCATSMEPMPKQSKNSSARTKVYLHSNLIRSAKAHSARNGFTLSGWINLILTKALSRKSAFRKKPR